MINKYSKVRDCRLGESSKVKQTILLVLFCASTVFASGSAVAQSTDEVNKQDASQVTLNLQDVDIKVLINTVAEVSGKNFIVDPRVKGKVSVISGAPLAPEELYDMFLSILEVHNFATVSTGNVIKILPSNVIKQRPTPTLFSATTENNDSQITQIIQLKHASVQELVPIIRPLIPPTSHFAPHLPSNSVVLTDTTANIQRVLKIIHRIDVPDKRAQVRVVYLDNAKASELANTLSQLVTASASPTDSSGPAVSIQALDSINALVISATDEKYTRIQALIGELDIERELQSNVNVIYLKHANAADLVTILNDVTASNVDGSVNTLSVQADEATNALIVKGSSSQFRSIVSVVDQLDLRRAQVYVETVIAEVSLSQMETLGIEFNGGDRLVASTDGFDDVSNVVSNPLGLTFNLLNAGSDQLNILVNALHSDSNSNVLSTPTILTLDNETAEIVVGQEVPFITGSFSNGFDTSTDADGNTGVNAFQTIERKDVGIKLQIKPQISEGDTIQLEVLQEISSVEPTEIEGQSDLITNTRSIEAIVQVDDGQVIVLGGLIQEDITDTVSGVPVLRSLPIVGALFRNTTKTAVKRNLMVFLKPHIIRSPDQLSKFTKKKYDESRRDSLLYKNNTAGTLLKDAKPPVLNEYEDVIGDGSFGTERSERIQNKHDRKEQKKADKKEQKANKEAQRRFQQSSSAGQ